MRQPSQNYVTGDIFTFVPPKRTLLAWEPLGDCIDILFLFQNSDVADGEAELPEWRLNWVCGMALLRCIGHCLHKVDAKKSKQHLASINDHWDKIRSDKASSWIFWEFVEKERNNILKAYAFGAKLSFGEGEAYIEYADGQDAFQLFRQAVYWWRHQLIEIEKLIPL